MSPRKKFTIGAATAAALLGWAGSAHAVLFSFASDDDSMTFTLLGSAGSGTTFGIQNGRTPQPTPVTLLVDDENGMLPTRALPMGLLINLTATHATSIPVLGAEIHTYSVTGTYTFVHPTTGIPLLNVAVNGGSELVVLGTATTWGSAGSINGSDAAGGANAVNHSHTADLLTYAQSIGQGLAGYGFLAAYMQESFGFTLSNANADGGIISLDAMSHLPTTSWGSEASYSSRAVGIPAPGAACLGVLAVGLGSRRRRRARASAEQ